MRVIFRKQNDYIEVGAIFISQTLKYFKPAAIAAIAANVSFTQK